MYNITIPIMHIKQKLYIIGSQRINLDVKNDQLLCRVGGGYEKFHEYVPKNSKYFQKMLVVHMIKSGESLEWVIDALMNGKKIKNIFDSKEKQDKNDSFTIKRSGSRNSMRSGVKHLDSYRHMGSLHGTSQTRKTMVVTPTRDKNSFPM